MSETNERIAMLETDLSWIKKELLLQNVIIGKTADNVTDIKIMLSKEEGKRSTLRYLGHAATVAAGGIMGLLGGHVGHP